MKETGNRPASVEVGNAWDLRSADIPHTNWIVGEFPTIAETSLRYMKQEGNSEENTMGAEATDIAVKWFVHQPGDPSAWGENKPTSTGRTISILAGDGEFELAFTESDEQYTVTLDLPGDFAIWGPGLGHSWTPNKTSTILTIRWIPK